MSAQGAQAAAEEARDHPALEWGARVGFAVYGVVYVVLAWLAIQVAVGDGSSASVSRQGALQEVARQPLGAVMLWLAFAGFCALALWEAASAVAGHHDADSGAKKVTGRLGSGLRAIVFAGFAVSSAEVALGSGSGGGTDSWTARLMRLPAGPVIVGAVGVVVVGYGGWSVVKAFGDRWRKELEPGGSTGPAVTFLARAGYSSRGIAFGIIGGLFVWAALTQDPRKSGGLDQALMRLRGAPFGTVLLALVALGLACFGVFNVAKAWHLRRR